MKRRIILVFLYVGYWYLLSVTTYFHAVVVSIDPHGVYLKSLDDVKFKTVKVSAPGPDGDEYAWYQCTVHQHIRLQWSQISSVMLLLCVLLLVTYAKVTAACRICLQGAILKHQMRCLK
ncbi:Aldolase-type TIM barrel-containing protein [Dioscorea alata]|uniref:Aldolase-type TIM barrel-containing protein n=1 Tax=Dioscorea alata TaxID=55571 RepID=A0ACB7URY1_DIOAL|nr:Aldolase-type TIM barrel-containing protein [Dioscorea alata]